MSQYTEQEQAAIIQSMRERQERNRFKPLVQTTKKAKQKARKASTGKKRPVRYGKLERELYSVAMQHMRSI